MEFDLTKRHCYYFNETTKIPHGSRNEKAISDYVMQFAKDHGLKAIQDEVYNVIVYKDASEGYENAAPLILQAHLDMVCEKNKDVDHDFTKDPLKLKVEDGILKAVGTTLGADDCVGVAYMLAILEDDNLKHPPLECIFTTMEEIGLIGSMHLNKENIHAHRMVSLDGGGEVTTALSSAGGCRVDVRKKLEFEKNEDATYFLCVKGLKGGHSGGEINKERGNANQLVIRILKEAQIAGVELQLVEYTGGLKENAIPREAEAYFASATSEEKIREAVEKTQKDVWTELEFSDPNFTVELKKVETAPSKIVKKVSDAIINYAYLMPNGFQHRSMAIEGLTLTSLNLGVVEMEEGTIVFHVSLRSALESGIENLIRVLSSLAEILDFEVSCSARYPGWNYNEVSPMRDIYAKVLLELQGKELKTFAGHGGNECGVFKGMIPDIDIITLGPVSKFVHTPDEQLDLGSFDRAYKLLCAVVSECK